MKAFFDLLQNWKDPFLQNTLGQYATVLVIIFIAVILRFIVCSIVYHRLASWVDSKRDELDEKVLVKIKRPLGYVIILWGIYVSTNVLSFPTDEAVKIKTFIYVFFTTLIAFSVAFVVLRFIDIFMIFLQHQASKTESKLDDQLVPLLSKSLKIFTWLLAFAVIVQNWGYSISGILAGLGIGGLALALAAKDTLSNLFGSVTIFTDSPFQIGDWIKVGSSEGVVEKVGFRSTRIRTFYKTEISIPNSAIANQAIDNFSRMQRRRISVTLSFTYETTADKMEEALKAIKSVLKNTEGVNQDFYIVNFTGFGASSLEVMLYYFTNTIVWTEYLDIREQVNLNIMRAMEKIGVEFAFDSMSVYFRSGQQGEIPKIKML